MKIKISQKAGVIILLIVFSALLAYGLYMNHQQASKKGSDSFFNLEVPKK